VNQTLGETSIDISFCKSILQQRVLVVIVFEVLAGLGMSGYRRCLEGGFGYWCSILAGRYAALSAVYIMTSLVLTFIYSYQY